MINVTSLTMGRWNHGHNWYHFIVFQSKFVTLTNMKKFISLELSIL